MCACTARRPTKGVISMTEKNNPDIKKSFKKDVVVRLASYFLRYKFSVAVCFVLMIVSNALALLGPYLVGCAINAIDLSGGVDFDAVFMYCALMAVFYVCSSVLSYVLSVMLIKLSQKIIRSMRQDVFDKILSLPVGYLDRMQAGDLINRISYDIDTINASLSNDILQAASGIITVIGAFIGMLLVSPGLLLAFIITIPLSVIITVKRSRSVRPLFRKRSASLAKLNGYSEEMLSGVKTIKAYGRQEVMIKNFNHRNKEAADAFYNADYYGSLIGPSVNLVNNLGTVLISTAGALMYISGAILIGDISSFLLYAKRFSGPINEYANIMGEIQSALAAGERVFRLLDARSEKDLKDAVALGMPEGKVEFSSVSFGYAKEKRILHDISFSAESGKCVAIVGPTGGGKTSIVNLLMRFYDPDEGEIKIDGTNIKHFTRSSLRAAFCMVLQDTWLFEGTVFENIAYGKRGATAEEVEAAADAAHIGDFIRSLPDGFNTVLTDGAVNLSKGQRQLLTIARAMLSPAKMLILDEATSNVDTATELLIRDAMNELMKGKTGFVIAHRLSTVKNADIILVVRDGRIIERGKHEELIEKGGFYNSIYMAQFE